MTKDKGIFIRCEGSELDKWKELAKRNEVSLSEFIRGVVTWYCETQLGAPIKRKSFAERLKERG